MPSDPVRRAVPPLGDEETVDERLSDQIERWLAGDQPKTLGSLIEEFKEKSFAIVFVFLLGVPALPLPTGGATHVFEVITMLLALQLIVGRDTVWLPQRWRRLELGGARQQRFIRALLKMIRFLERFSRPRLAVVFEHRLGSSVFGLLVLLSAIGAFVAPPFSGLDTLPALGGVLVSLGVLLRDIAVVVVGVLLGAAGAVLEVVLGRAAFDLAKSLI